MELKESIIAELKNFKAHASEMERWACEMIKKLDSENKPKMGKGLTPEESARGRARLRKKMYK